MCGIPAHSVNVYIPKLIDKGYKVGICEQIEDPKDAVGIVKRDVIKIITPGTITDLNILDDKKNNYISAYIKDKKEHVFAYSDISTGEVYVSTIFDNENILIDELSRINPSEIILDNSITDLTKRFDIYISKYNNDTNNFKNLIVDVLPLQEKVLSVLLNYIYETQKGSIDQINKCITYEINKHIKLDINSRKNLEILESTKDRTKKGSLLYVMDKTVTSMGSRLFRKWIESPLLDLDTILTRQQGIDILLNKYDVADDLILNLKELNDIERLICKISSSNSSCKELISLKNSFKILPKIYDNIIKLKDNIYFKDIFEKFDTMNDLYNLLDKSINDDPPITIKEGNIIKDGYDTNIDELKNISSESKNWLMELEAREKTLTNISKLKVGYSRIFGYYIEVTNSYLLSVPKDRYKTLQTLAGCERYTIPELKEIESKILNASEKLNDLEYIKYLEIKDIILKNMFRIQKMSYVISSIDAILSLSIIAKQNKLVKPTFNNNNIIDISEGRHPVVETYLKDEFIPNDTYLNDTDDTFDIITGPNMSR
ncbi:MAG: DNA mismatch repair protein MutS [Clostridia bacterium]